MHTLTWLNCEPSCRVGGVGMGTTRGADSQWPPVAKNKGGKKKKSSPLRRPRQTGRKCSHSERLIYDLPNGSERYEVIFSMNAGHV